MAAFDRKPVRYQDGRAVPRLSARPYASVAVPPEPGVKKFNRLGRIDGRMTNLSGNANIKHLASGATTNERIYLIHNGLVVPRIDVLILMLHWGSYCFSRTIITPL